jgi:hypothetical protein
MAEALIKHIRDYEQYFPERLDEQELILGGLFAVMFAIKKSTIAVQMSARIVGVASPLNGSVDFRIVDEDLRPTSRIVVARLSDGVITNNFQLQPLGVGERGYFMGSDDALDTELDLLNVECIPHLV